MGDIRRHIVLKFTAEGKLLTQWGGPGFDPGEFARPAGIVVTGQGEILVAESLIFTQLNNRIQKFAPRATPATRSTWGAIKRTYR